MVLDRSAENRARSQARLGPVFWLSFFGTIVTLIAIAAILVMRQERKAAYELSPASATAAHAVLRMAEVMHAVPVETLSHASATPSTLNTGEYVGALLLTSAACARTSATGNAMSIEQLETCNMVLSDPALDRGWP